MRFTLYGYISRHEGRLFLSKCRVFRRGPLVKELTVVDYHGRLQYVHATVGRVDELVWSVHRRSGGRLSLFFSRRLFRFQLSAFLRLVRFNTSRHTSLHRTGARVLNVRGFGVLVWGFFFYFVVGVTSHLGRY